MNSINCLLGTPPLLSEPNLPLRSCPVKPYILALASPPLTAEALSLLSLCHLCPAFIRLFLLLSKKKAHNLKTPTDTAPQACDPSAAQEPEAREAQVQGQPGLHGAWERELQFRSQPGQFSKTRSQSKKLGKETWPSCYGFLREQNLLSCWEAPSNRTHPTQHVLRGGPYIRGAKLSR